MISVRTLDQLEPRYDLLVVGAGPAGLAAATTASSLGLRVLVVDENIAPGGQIYRCLDTAPPARRRLLGPSYEKGDDLLRAFQNSGVSYMAEAAVWGTSSTRGTGISSGGQSRFVEASHIVLATGAMERPFPIAGWTLPGVMTVGAAQILLKSSGLIPQGRFVLAGTGPLIWQFASQLLAAGAKPLALLNTSGPPNFLRAGRGFAGFARSPYFLQGLQLLIQVHRSIPVISSVKELAAEGAGLLQGVSYRQGRGAMETIKADGLFLHQGIVPNVNLASAAGCEMTWDDVLACWKPIVDRWGRSSVAGISIVGDGATIEGADVARQRGHLCGLDGAYRLNAIDEARRDELAASILKLLKRYRRGRTFLDAAFRPDQRFRIAAPRALACRCEEVTGEQIEQALARWVKADPNQLKALLRCGMGPCQGRLCGLTVTEMIADARQVSPAAVGYYRSRPPVKPIPLDEIALLSAVPDLLHAGDDVT